MKMSSSPSDSGSSGGASNSNCPAKHSPQRKQHARLAARSRRSAEAGLFQDLGLALPISPAVLKSLDKLAVLRVAVCYVKLRAVLEELRLLSPMEGQYDDFLLGALHKDEKTDAVMGDNVFLVVLSTSGELIYVSDNVGKCLRCDKFMILGTNINDFVHRTDRDHIAWLLSTGSQQIFYGGRGASFKTPRKSTTVLLRSGQSLCLTGKVFSSQQQQFFIGLAESLPHPLSNTFPYPHFKIRAELDWVCSAEIKFLRGDTRTKTFLGYAPSDLVGLSAFALMHPADLPCVYSGVKKMFSNGSFQTPACYRLLVRGGGWAWFMTRLSTVKVQQRGSDGVPETVTFCVGRNYMVSDVFDRGQIVAPVQLGGRAPPSAVVHHFGEAGPPPQGFTPPETPPTEIVEELPESPSAIDSLRQFTAASPMLIEEQDLDELVAMLGDDHAVELVELIDQLDTICGDSDTEAGKSFCKMGPPPTVPSNCDCSEFESILNEP